MAPLALTRAAYALLPLAGIAIAVVIGHETLLRGTVADEYAKQQALCSVPGRARLPSDLTRGYVTPVDNLLCIATPMLRDAVSSEEKIGLQALIFSIAVPLLYRLNHLSVSPNFNNICFKGFTPMLAVILSPILGPGVVAAGLIVPLYAIGMWLQTKNTTASLNPLPVPASSIYSSNLSIMSLVVLLFFTYAFDPENISSSGRSNWLLAAILFSLWPFYQGSTMPLAASSTKAPKDEMEARQMIKAHDSDAVSYGFERIWGYYRRLSLVALGMYWFSLVRIFRLIRAIVSNPSLLQRVTGNNKTGLAETEYRFVLNAGALAFAAAAVIFVERLTIRTVRSAKHTVSAAGAGANAGAVAKKGAAANAGAGSGASAVVEVTTSRHPLTGKPRSQLDVDCLRAVSAAPAGVPFVETGWGVALAYLIGGPGFASLLWWSRGEEEMGWKARKAWRGVVAVEGKKQ